MEMKRVNGVAEKMRTTADVYFGERRFYSFQRMDLCNNAKYISYDETKKSQNLENNNNHRHNRIELSSRILEG